MGSLKCEFAILCLTKMDDNQIIMLPDDCYNQCKALFAARVSSYSPGVMQMLYTNM